MREGEGEGEGEGGGGGDYICKNSCSTYILRLHATMHTTK